MPPRAKREWRASRCRPAVLEAWCRLTVRRNHMVLGRSWGLLECDEKGSRDVQRMWKASDCDHVLELAAYRDEYESAAAAEAKRGQDAGAAAVGGPSGGLATRELEATLAAYVLALHEEDARKRREGATQVLSLARVKGLATCKAIRLGAVGEASLDLANGAVASVQAAWVASGKKPLST